MKKPGFTMPKDRADAVQAFVDQGREIEAPATAAADAGTPVKGKTARLQVDLPQELHRRFKTACAAEGIKMAEVVTEFVEGWTTGRR